jgi:hypothetical protein
VVESDGPVDGETTAPTKGRGAATKKTIGKRIRGRTIYLPDDLFERILVQAHRRDRTISEYVAGILDRQVPDHRVRVEPIEETPQPRIEQEG